MTGLSIPAEIILDARNDGGVFIDGERLPWPVAQNIAIDEDPGRQIIGVRLTFFTDSVVQIERDGTTTRTTSAEASTAMQSALDRADRYRSEEAAQ